ncbi:hypothetical protein Lesp02_32580 [Lentzea sp. NBRC 105346]|uniref:GAF domain-containing protein n=1 Tax=Lentzea sp. NBRC 105346 TaxID=3032205 RepID=UPI0024A429AD|nr:GAF domain-containing protein [Lentzea sp. NBRC 105346]GLZ31069.1 hypothetical protein Lesp02_32580 [Lentzea sp. NBRC 105346]
MGPQLDELADVLQVACKVNGADRGNVQLFDRWLGGLRIVTHTGFENPFLDFFKLVRDDGSACAAAMRRGDVVVVDDVRRSPLFDRAAKQIMVDAGALSVQSTPLITSDGRLVGMLNTHSTVRGSPRAESNTSSIGSPTSRPTG